MDDHLHGYYDVVGVLVMTRIVGHCQLLMTHAQVPVLDSFLDRVRLMLWPHFSRLIREHIDAVTNGKALLNAHIFLICTMPNRICIVPCNGSKNPTECGR